MNIQQMKDNITTYINQELLPVYSRFRSSFDIQQIAFLDEKLEVLNEKWRELQQHDPEVAEELYRYKIQTLPTKDELLDEYLKEKYGKKTSSVL